MPREISKSDFGEVFPFTAGNFTPKGETEIQCCIRHTLKGFVKALSMDYKSQAKRAEIFC